MPKLGGITKEKIAVTVDIELLNWIDKEVSSRKYSSRSHAVEYAIFKLKQISKK